MFRDISPQPQSTNMANVVYVSDSKSTYLFTTLSCKIQQNLYFSLSTSFHKIMGGKLQSLSPAVFLISPDHKRLLKYLRIMHFSIPHPSSTTYQYPEGGPRKVIVETASPSLSFYPRELSGAAGLGFNSKRRDESCRPRGTPLGRKVKGRETQPYICR